MGTCRRRHPLARGRCDGAWHTEPQVMLAKPTKRAVCTRIGTVDAGSFPINLRCLSRTSPAFLPLSMAIPCKCKHNALLINTSVKD
jgi:hypothetical protein